MKKYELIIFDCDGTLVDSEPLTNRLIATLINERGIDITTTECLDRFAGKTIGHITSFIAEHISDHDEKSFEVEYRARCKTIFEEELQPIEGVEDLLEALTVPFCVASNGPLEKMAITLPASGLDKYFKETNTFSAYQVEAWKPKPDLFLHAAREMNVDPSKALVIEDTWSGVMGAVNGSIDVWVYNAHLDNRVFIDQIPNFFNMSSLRQNLMAYI